MPQFPTTCWSLIQHASQEPTSGSRENMGELLRRYQQPMLLHLQFKGVPVESAEDLVQEFMLEMLDQQLLSIADANKGRFRTLLLTALDRFAISRHRYETAAKRRPKDLQSLDAAENDQTTDAAPPPDSVFQRAWALDVLAEALAAMQRECSEHGQQERWEVFDRRVVGPLLEDRPATSYAELSDSLGLATEKTAMNVLVTAKRQFARVLREVVRDYVTRSQDGRPTLADAADEGPEAVQNSAARQLAEHAVQKAIDRELMELSAALAAPPPDGDRLATAAEPAPGEDPLKHSFWQRLTGAGQAESGDAELASDSRRQNLHSIYETANDLGDQDLGVCYRDFVKADIRHLLGSGCGVSGPLSRFLFAQEPDFKLLEHLKEWATVQRLSNSNAVSGKIASAIYFATIAAALSFNGSVLTGLTSESLAAGLEWLDEQQWIDAETRSLANRARASLAA